MTGVFDFQASPGNLQQFEDVLFGNNEMSSSAGVMAFKLLGDSGQKVNEILVCTFCFCTLVIFYCNEKELWTE